MVALFPPHQLQSLLLPLLLHIHLIEQYNRDLQQPSADQLHDLQRNSSLWPHHHHHNYTYGHTTRRPLKPTDNPKRQSLFGEDEYLIGVGWGDFTGPGVDMNVLNLMRRIIMGAEDSGALNELVKLQHPQLREFTDLKLQVKVNFNPLLLRAPLVQSLTRWVFPNRVRFQVEYTYVNLIVQLQ